VCSAHLILLDFHHPNNTLCRVGVMKFFIMKFSQTSCYFLSFRFSYSPRNPF